MSQLTRRRGFTLPEVLVTIALLSLLAAVVIPSVVGQITSGETSKVEQNLLAIRSGVEQFASDVHRYPGRPTQLFVKPDTMTDVNSLAFPAPLASRWKGPYLHKDSTSFFLASGFGAGGTILDKFVLVTGSAGVQYIAAQVTGLRNSDAIRIDRDLDDYSVSGDESKGMIRSTVSGTSTIVTFLLIPVQ